LVPLLVTYTVVLPDASWRATDTLATIKPIFDTLEMNLGSDSQNS
jgi:hypothetical protein